MLIPMISESTNVEPWFNGTKKRLNIVYSLFYMGVRKEIAYFVQMNYESTKQDRTKAKFVYRLSDGVRLLSHSCPCESMNPSFLPKAKG